MKLKKGFVASNNYVYTELKGEVGLVVAIGKAEIKSFKKSAQISIDTEVNQHPITGFCYPETNVYDLIKNGIEADSDVILRFEKQRKKDIDNKIPMAELVPDMATAKKNVIHACVGIYDVNNKKWVLTNEAASDPKNDSQDIIKLIDNATNLDDEIDPEAFFKQNKPKLSIPTPSTFDKQQQLITMYYFILGCSKKYGYELKSEAAKAISIKLLKLADEIYKVIKKSDVVDYKDYVHTRARFIIFNYEEYYSNFSKEACKNINEWMRNCYSSAKELLEWAELTD